MTTVIIIETPEGKICFCYSPALSLDIAFGLRLGPRMSVRSEEVGSHEDDFRDYTEEIALDHENDIIFTLGLQNQDDEAAASFILNGRRCEGTLHIQIDGKHDILIPDGDYVVRILGGNLPAISIGTK